MFPSERFVRAGATVAEAGEIGALYGRHTTLFDGAADGELRRVIEEYRDRLAGALMDEDWMQAPLPDDPSDDVAEPEAAAHEPTEQATEGKRARNQSRSSRPAE